LTPNQHSHHFHTSSNKHLCNSELIDGHAVGISRSSAV
jgi:hypothetical protein